MIRVGCAGWPLPRDPDSLFASSGTHLERYAAVFPASEINSTFHRSHRTATFARWAQSVPAGFRFSVKLPKAITHVARLAAEPRHESWFSPDAVELLQSLEISRVAADPPRVPGGDDPGGWCGIAYYRLHGSPRMYYASYDDAYLAALAARLAVHRRAGRETWCIFDNTAGQAAVPNALRLMDELENAVQGENLRFGRGYRTVPGNRRSHAAEPVPKPGKSEGDEWPRGKR